MKDISNLIKFHKMRNRPNNSMAKASAEESGGEKIVSGIVWFVSIVLILCTLPFSLLVTVKMVQEYERAIIFRLGQAKRFLKCCRSIIYVAY